MGERAQCAGVVVWQAPLCFQDVFTRRLDGVTYCDLLLFVCLFAANDHRHSLGSNKISDAGARDIAEALKTNSTLMTLE